MLHISLCVETLNMFHGNIQGAQVMQPWSVNFSFSFFFCFFTFNIPRSSKYRRGSDVAQAPRLARQAQGEPRSLYAGPRAAVRRASPQRPLVTKAYTSSIWRRPGRVLRPEYRRRVRVGKEEGVRSGAAARGRALHSLLRQSHPPNATTPQRVVLLFHRDFAHTPSSQALGDAAGSLTDPAPTLRSLQSGGGGRA